MEKWSYANVTPSRFPPKKEIEEGRRLTLFPGMGVWLLTAEKEGRGGGSDIKSAAAEKTAPPPPPPHAKE